MGERNVSNVLKIKEISYGQVELRDERLVQARMLELQYLKSLDADRLLAGFVETAGLSKKADRYKGWESTEIQGHTLGHYLTALSQAYADTKQEDLLTAVVYTIEELAKCQGVDGYLFASHKEIFDRVENKRPAWVPWYTMHKILSGIIAVYKYTENKSAYQVMSKLGDWIYNRAIAWSEELQKVVLTVEYGGMNDCLYDLFIATGNNKYEKAAHQFDELSLFEAFYEKKDILNGLHANTTIPKILGAVKRYVALGKEEEYYLQVAENFWDIVVNHHTYITGGNSEWEHFGEPDILDAERTACNCETCNTYNMLKLSKLLFQITGNHKYADYYERTFINAVQSSQNPETGMTMYFQPMATGFFKVFGTPYDRFWCCTGSGMENFTKLVEGIYFFDSDTFYINRYVDSNVIWAEKKLGFDIKVDLFSSDKVEIIVHSMEGMSAKHEVVETEDTYEEIQEDTTADNNTFALAIRYPEWQKRNGILLVNGVSIEYVVQRGYIIIQREWKKNDRVVITLPMDLAVHELPDNSEVVAFTYGPFVLSAGLGSQMLDTTITGVDVLVPTKEMILEDYIVLQGVDIKEWKENIGKYLVKSENEISFTLHQVSNDRSLFFTPHFARYEDRYGIYWRLYKKESNELKLSQETTNREQEIQMIAVDTIPVGNDQYELAHAVRGMKTDTTREKGHRCRFTKDDGWFSYQLKVEDGQQLLCTTYCSQDEGNEFDIYINDTLLIHEKVIREDRSEFYTKAYNLPIELLYGNSIVTVRFQNISNLHTCRIYDELYIIRG